MRYSLRLFALAISLCLPAPLYAQPAEIATAARSGDVNRVTELLESGVDPDPTGMATPLYFAAQGGLFDMAAVLLRYGADPSALSNWGTPLHVASHRGHLQIARLLLSHGADASALGGELNNTPLHEAAYTGNIEIGRLLIENGADANARNREFEPPIHLAVQKGHEEFAELLRDNGAGPIKVDPIASNLAHADLEQGRIKALECSVCHQLDRNAASTGSGPRLWNIVGRDIATDDFPYSDALAAQSGSWTYERLNAFLADPAGTVPGSGMYRGNVPSRTERINLIAYLRTLSDIPEPLPP